MFALQLTPTAQPLTLELNEIISSEGENCPIGCTWLLSADRRIGPPLHGSYTHLFRNSSMEQSIFLIFLEKDMEPLSTLGLSC